MTSRQVERITQLDIRRIDDDLPNHYGLFMPGSEIPLFSEHGKVIQKVMGRLVERNWTLVRQVVLERARYRCEECGRFAPLSVHHQVFRSHGRKDTASNCTALCNVCHEAKHGRKQK